MGKSRPKRDQGHGEPQLPKHRFSDDRVRDFLELFSRESEHIRDSILRDLPAYNSLLSLQAFSFEELALQHIAAERGIKYSRQDSPAPQCPYCGSDNVSPKKDAGPIKKNLFRCYACSHTFSANHNSIVSGTKCSALVWMKVIQCLLSFAPITKTCEYCGITETTYYNLRNRIFYAMQLLLDDVKLYGNIEVDNTFVRISYKGVNLQESEFSEDSIFFDPSFKPREAKNRGAADPNHGRNANNICIFTAIDDRGHVMARFVGVGVVSYLTLKSALPANKYLYTVPDRDPFPLTKDKSTEPTSKCGDPSCMVSDKEKAIKKYAEDFLKIPFESHVYRYNNVQRRLTKGSRNIQRVNALHSRLKVFLRNCNYVSSKYLPGYLTLFEFLENTGGSRKATEQLFRILAQPNLGKSADFYQEMFSVPNYLESWLNSDHPLKKLPYNKLLAFYLYDHIRNKDLYPGIDVSMQYIEEESGYTAAYVRKIYRQLNAAGYRDLILEHFGEPTKARSLRARNDAPTSLSPVVLAIYDEYAQMRQQPRSSRQPFQQFIDEKNKQYGTAFKRTNLLAKFKIIEERGVRPPLPDFKEPERFRRVTVNKIMLDVLAEYENVVLPYRQRGEKPPSNLIIYGIIGEKFHLSPFTVEGYLWRARAYKKETH